MAILENAVGGFFAGQATEIIKKLLKIIGHEIRLAWGLREELQKLQTMLLTLSGMLAGVLGKPTTNEMMIMWLKKIRTVVYDAEDLLDEWSYEKLEKNTPIQTTSPQKKIKIIQKTMTKTKENFKKPISHQDSAHKVRNLLKSIKDILDEAKDYGIKPIKVAGEVHEQSGGEREQKLKDQRQFVDYKSLFGRKDDLKQIVALLEDAGKTNATLNVIGIVGMAGMGKTALSKEVTDKVNKLFDQVISVTVSHDYKLSVILKRIAGKVTADRSLITGEADEIVSKVKEKLETKKYLLVLDDVWDTIDWEPLKAALLGIGGREGTTILVTSRRRDVVAKLKTDGLLSIYPLGKLSEADSWSLFKDILSADEQLIEGSEKKDIATRMVSKCGGLPLALKLLGDLLRNYSDMEKWREFDKSEAWKINDEHDILPSLKLSYMYLKSPALKTCFSYCAIFGEDEEIEKDYLVRLWMAQGFLQPQNHTLMEVLGEEYFDDLLNSSLFHEPVLDRLGNVTTVKMHDLVRALAFDISKEDIWCCGQNEKASGSYNEFRHISVPPECEDDIFPTNCYKLRTFLTSKKVLSLDFLKDCKNLRALSFQLGPDSRLKEKDCEVLGTLKHLRFLEIIFDEEVSADCVKKIIESQLFPHIAKLYHLQTLITFTFIFGVYDDNIDVDDDYKDVNIPKQLGNLVNLRHLLLHGHYVDIFEGLGLFTALQTLPKIRFKKRESGQRENKRIKLGSNEGGKLSELQLKNLRGTLVLEDLDCINEQEARSLCLEEKSSLTSLQMETIMQNEIMEALKPHRSVIGLCIEDFCGTELPTWLTGSGCFSNLVFLELINFEGVQGELNLRTFNSLRQLLIIDCNQLTVEFHGFKHCKQLTKLFIRNCDKVVSIPDMSPLTKLRELTVIYQKLNTTLPCSNLSLIILETHGNLLPTLNPNDHLCQSLITLNLWAATDENKSLPDQMQHFVALQNLSFNSFSIIETLPEFIGNLTSLTSLHLDNMTKLRYLPSEDAMNRLSNLTTVRFYRCPELEEKRMRENGEWVKICHLPNIRVDDNSYGNDGLTISMKKFFLASFSNF